MLCPNCKTPLEKDPDGIHYVCPSCESRFKAKQKTTPKPTAPPTAIPKPKPKVVKPKPQPEPEWDDEEEEDEDVNDSFDMNDDEDDDFDDFEDTPKRSKAKAKPRAKAGKSGGFNFGIIILSILCIGLAAATGFMVFQYQKLRKNYDTLVQQQDSFDSFSSFDEAPEAVDSMVTDPLSTEPEINTDGMGEAQPYDPAASSESVVVNSY